MAAFNPTNQLNSLKLQASLALGADNRLVLTGQYFNIWGTADANLYGTDPLTGLALTPNSNGFTTEIAYIPYGARRPDRPAIHLLQQVQRYDGRCPGQQHRVPARLAYR
jgi:hypothetical protein